jgi:hypothetical protein
MSSENTKDATGPLSTDSLSTGPLRNGNPRGDPNLALRCGAKSRKPGGDPCQAPAMANGRCRLHGGLSTGPRTEEGRARIRAARTTHGGYSAETQAALRRANDLIAETRTLLAQLNASTFRPTPARAAPPAFGGRGGMGAAASAIGREDPYNVREAA